MARLSGFAQRVIALDVSLRFVRQSQSLRRLHRRRVHRLSVDQAVPWTLLEQRYPTNESDCEKQTSRSAHGYLPPTQWRSEALARVRAYSAVWMSAGRSPSAWPCFCHPLVARLCQWSQTMCTWFGAAVGTVGGAG